MKKNLMSVIILALVVANFVLTAIMMFTVMPSVNKANELITKVCEAIDLDLNSGAATGLANLPNDQVEVYDVAAGETMTVSLKDGGYAVVAIAIFVNNESDEYVEDSAGVTPLTTKESMIKGAVNEIFGQYTKDELQTARSSVRDEVLNYLRKQFGANYVVDVDFPTYLLQD